MARRRVLSFIASYLRSTMGLYSGDLRLCSGDLRLAAGLASRL